VLIFAIFIIIAFNVYALQLKTKLNLHDFNFLITFQHLTNLSSK